MTRFGIKCSNIY